MRRASLALLVVAVSSLLAAAAQATPATPKRLWATVNVCDTGGKSNTVGLRANMPGNGTGQRMYMRFQLQWYRPAAGRYVSIEPPSTWVSAGSAKFRSAQRGFDFLKIDDPPEGQRYKFRGVVRFQWRELRAVEGKRRKREVVVKRAKRITRGGLKGVKGGEPPGRSDAVCVVEGPEPEPEPPAQ
jgi:hypothetical protein